MKKQKKEVDKMNSFGATDKGLRRKENQDRFKIAEKEGSVFAVVCDGIGGNKAGDVAASLTCEVIQNYYKNNYDGQDIISWLSHAVEIVNRAVFEKSQEEEKYSGMGTTLVSSLITDDKTYVINVGDSRCYILDKNDRLVQVTNDHTVLNELVQNKGIDYQIASKFVGKNVISRAIGIIEDIEADIYQLNGEDYKMILLCSDGLHGYVEEEVIRSVLLQESTLEEKCQKLVDLANDAGGYDNVTVVLSQR